MSILSSRPDVLGINPAVVEPRPDEPRAAAVAAVHAEADQQTRAFAERTGITCPPGCGQCCLSPHVETTVADLLPLAEHVVQTGRAEAILQRIEAATDPRCVLYDADPADPARGRCSMYALRPSICRLFGFAGRRDADGNPQFTACRIHRDTMPEVVAAAQQAVGERRIGLPIFADMTRAVTAAAPNSDGRPRPINDALRQAIHAVALTARLRQLTDDTGDDDLTPPTPRVPPRRKAA